MASALTPATLQPNQVAYFFVEAALAKHKTRQDVIFLKAFLAGVFLSYGNLLSIIVSGGSPTLTTNNPGLTKLIAGFTFPIGLTLIVLTGQELLTSNMFTFPMAVLRRRVPFWSLGLNWLVVFFGNLAGSLFTAAILVKYSGVLSSEPYHTYVIHFVNTKVNTPEWHQIFLRGIGCNWLVCLAVWVAAGSNETVSKIVALWLPIWLFVAAGYDHVIANMFSIPLSIMEGGDLTTGKYIWKSLIPAFIGNVVGALFVALPAWWFYLRDEHGRSTELDSLESGNRSPETDILEDNGKGGRVIISDSGKRRQ
ncbi:putative formate/nitrite transporter [Atractiella rhizophila]|nr:putative formate/nitrite transporter [Atractiella rhizophila]